MIRTTFLTDGTSDRVLSRILDWTLFQCGVRAEIVSQWADLRGIACQPGLKGRAEKALELYTCDLLFVHRDSEGQARELRITEIGEALSGSGTPPYVAVVPVRMQESWLLCDEAAIRRASGNPAGSVALNMPAIHDIEGLPDSKEVLYSLLRRASEKTGRRLSQFNVEFARSLVVDQMDNFSRLRGLNSFQQFEWDMQSVVQQHHLGSWK